LERCTEDFYKIRKFNLEKVYWGFL
jgi:hypothetical protein